MNRLLKLTLAVIIFFLFASFSFVLHAFYISPSHTFALSEKKFAKDSGGNPDAALLLKNFSDLLEEGNIEKALPLLASADNEKNFLLMKKALETEKSQGSLPHLISLIRLATLDASQSPSSADLIFSVFDPAAGNLLGEVIIRKNQIVGNYQIHSF
ncbi:MAG: hypothetical protein FJY91_00755 [Candidatus Harrisonbacteria bacterium]|nr:hypothetical protein [Candidatus Harrisonbacteria bacterium]